MISLRLADGRRKVDELPGEDCAEQHGATRVPVRAKVDGSKPLVIFEAVGVPVLTGRVDIANARVRFANGCIVNLTASRISRDRVRKIRFFQPAAYLSIDQHESRD
jgi:hypothetical protein